MLAHDPAIAENFKSLDKDVDFWPVYEAIKCPTLLLQGEDSDVLSFDVAEAMTQRGPKAKWITVHERRPRPGADRREAN